MSLTCPNPLPNGTCGCLGEDMREKLRAALEKIAEKPVRGPLTRRSAMRYRRIARAAIKAAPR